MLTDCVLLGVNGNQRFSPTCWPPEFAAGNATTAFIAEHFASDQAWPAAAPASELATAAALLFQQSANARRIRAAWRAGAMPAARRGALC